jgi:hypothetical protein
MSNDALATLDILSASVKSSAIKNISIDIQMKAARMYAQFKAKKNGEIKILA